LTEGQPEVGPLERDVTEADRRPARRLLRAQPFGIHLNPRQRDASLHAPLHVDERNLHVDCRRQLGLGDLQLFEFYDLACFRARWTRGTIDH
jgi:hypothetical protein